MKVIKKGNGKYWWVGVKVKCFGCGAVIELEKNDGFVGQRTVMVKCPECGTWPAYATQKYGGDTY